MPDDYHPIALMARPTMKPHQIRITACSLLLFLSACGRIGYSTPSPTPEDSGVDAAQIDLSTETTMDALPDGTASDSSDESMVDTLPDAVADSRVDGGAAAGIQVTPLSGLTTTESGGVATFTVVLMASPVAPVSIALSSSNEAEGTVAPAALTFDSANWDAPQTVTIEGVDDAFADGNQTYTIVLAPATSVDPEYAARDADDVTVVNIDDDSPGAIVGESGTLLTTETGGTDSFSIRLTTAPAFDVIVSLSTDAPDEATVSPASITFTPLNWASPATVTVTGADDAEVDGDQAFSVLTADAVSSDPSYNGLAISDVAGLNLDDDTAGLVLTPTAGLTTTEGGGTATFAFSLQSRPTADVTVPLLSSDTSEGNVSETSVTFTTTDWNLPRIITVTGVDDLVADGNQVFRIETGPATSADPNYDGLHGTDVTVSNIDDETAHLDVSPLSGLVTTEGGGTAAFSVALGSIPSADVTIEFTSSDVTEGGISPATCTFTPATWNAPCVVTLTGVDDPVADGNQTYDAIVHVGSSADPMYSGLADVQVHASNSDDETAGITVLPLAGLVTSEAGTADSFGIVLNSQPTADVAISLSTSDGTEGLVLPASLTFTSGNWNLPQTVTVTGVDDDVDDGDIAFVIVTSAAVSADASYSGLAVSDVSVTNLDNDAAGVSVSPTSGLTTTEAGGTATFDVVLLSQPTASVTISVSSSDATEGSAAPASLLFLPGTWNVPQTVTVTGIDDFGVDGDILYTVVTSTAASADGVYNARAVPDVTVTNVDNDAAGVVVSPTSGLTTTEAGGTATFTIVLTSSPSANVTILVSSSNTNEGVISPSGVVFTAANWSTPQTVTITGRDDVYDDGDQAYSIVSASATSTDLLYSGINPADVSVTNADNDTAAVLMAIPDGLVVSEDRTRLMLPITINCATSASITLTLASSDTTEGTVTAGSTIGPLSPINVPFTYLATVAGVDDLLLDGDQPFTITASVSSADLVWNGVTAMRTYTTLDNDSATIIATPNNLVATEAPGGTATFQMVLTHAPSANVTVNLTSDDLTEGTVAPAAVTFTTGNWSTPQTVTISGVADGVLDGDQAFHILTSAGVSTDLSYSGIDAPDITVTTVDVQTGRSVSVNSAYWSQQATWSATTSTAVSTDGRYVVFDSGTALVAGDTNGVSDVFVRDRTAGVTTRVSVTNAGAQANGSNGAMSSDGRYVAFTSTLGTLVAGDSNGVKDVFLRDTVMGTTVRVSLSELGAELNAASDNPVVSRDGRFVAFTSSATNAVAGDTNANDDVFVRDTQLGTTIRASLSSSGVQGTGLYGGPSISDDGRYVVFCGFFGYVAIDTNGAQDIYVRDTVMNTTSLISVAMSGTSAGVSGSVNPRITPDGRYVLFGSNASNLVAGDTNQKGDIFVRDRMLGTTVIASLGQGGVQGNLNVNQPASISDDGTIVAFQSFGDNLVPGDVNGTADAFARNLLTATTTMISRSPLGANENGRVLSAPMLSGDGQTAAILTDATNIMIPGYDNDTNGTIYAVPVP